MSISGRDEKQKKEYVSNPNITPQCGCSQAALRTIVKMNTANKGRPYFHCAKRVCSFFVWADANERKREELTWRRFPTFIIVTDFGFSAEDLRQGGVGDCWFLSALACVAERHDLIAKLFADTATNVSGCYNLRLFLDGFWTSVLVDDLLPCSEQPRREQQVADTGLAFSRGTKSQLWVCLLEKAYAKAHGAYQAISGGQISEALLDLTGAPTFRMDFSSAGFSLSTLWTQLRYFRAHGLPMGCATDSNPELHAVGLSGNHAYSILECRELPDPDARFDAADPAPLRLLRIRNPHGEGEWLGDWAARSQQWQRRLQGLSRAGQQNHNDGTFWMDLTHFVMAFARLDVCFAMRDWHAASFPNEFPDKQSPLRVCSKCYRVRVAPAPGRERGIKADSVTLYVLALQPTKRGAYCRGDRKKSYAPADVWILVSQITAGGLLPLAASNLESDSLARATCVVSLPCADPTADFCVLLLNWGGPPKAADCTKGQPFSVRFVSSEPLETRAQPFEGDALFITPRTGVGVEAGLTWRAATARCVCAWLLGLAGSAAVRPRVSSSPAERTWHTALSAQLAPEPLLAPGVSAPRTRWLRLAGQMHAGGPFRVCVLESGGLILLLLIDLTDPAQKVSRLSTENRAEAGELKHLFSVELKAKGMLVRYYYLYAGAGERDRQIDRKASRQIDN